MRKAIFMLMSLLCLGCTYEGSKMGDYLNDPRSIIKDPHFTEYKQTRDELERQYLHEEITYSDYVEKMDALDQQYNEEVEKRNAILSN